MISVIMLTYNRIQRMRDMVSDMLNQTYRHFEFIIIDNGSTDGTAEELAAYSRQDDRIKVLSTRGGTVGYARNIGVKEACGEYIAFVDDDDRVAADFLDFLYDLIKKYDADISMCGASEVLSGIRQPQCLFEECFVLTPAEAVRELLDRKHIRAGMPTKLIKRELLLKYPFEEDKKHEDIHTIYKYLAEANKTVIWGKEKYCFVRHGNNLSFYTSDQSRWTKEEIEEYLCAFKNRSFYLHEILPEVYGQAKYSEWAYMLSMIEKIEKYRIKECK